MLKSTFYKLAICIAIVVIAYFGKTLLIPLVMGMVLAILVDPVQKFFVKKKWPRSIAIGMAVLTLIAGLFIIGGLVSWQTVTISNESENFAEQANNKLREGTTYIQEKFNLSDESVEKYTNNVKSGLISSAKSFLGSFTSFISASFLVLIYLILFLLQKERFQKFLLKILDKDKEKGMQLMNTSGKTIRKYFLGKLFVMIILGAVYAGGFTIAGIKYGLMLALISAILSIIPYLGNIFGAFLVVAVVVISGGSYILLLVALGIMALAQVLESYVLQPLVIGDQINLNPFAVIFGVVAFGMIWGIVGTILSLSIVGVMRDWFYAYPSLKPYGYLLDNANEE